jgi:hypothetical protein
MLSDAITRTAKPHANADLPVTALRTFFSYRSYVVHIQTAYIKYVKTAVEELDTNQPPRISETHHWIFSRWHGFALYFVHIFKKKKKIR